MPTINITNSPAEVDWTTVRGDTFLEVFEIREGDSASSPLADLDGDSFVMTITDNRGAQVDELTLGDGISVISEGTVQLHRTAAETGTWPNCKTTFTLKWTNDTDPVVVKTIITGKI